MKNLKLIALLTPSLLATECFAGAAKELESLEQHLSAIALASPKPPAKISLENLKKMLREAREDIEKIDPKNYSGSDRAFITSMYTPITKFFGIEKLEDLEKLPDEYQKFFQDATQDFTNYDATARKKWDEIDAFNREQKAKLERVEAEKKFKEATQKANDALVENYKSVDDPVSRLFNDSSSTFEHPTAFLKRAISGFMGPNADLETEYFKAFNKKLAAILIARTDEYNLSTPGMLTKSSVLNTIMGKWLIDVLGWKSNSGSIFEKAEEAGFTSYKTFDWLPDFAAHFNELWATILKKSGGSPSSSPVTKPKPKEIV